jgi:hypothetical protein
MSNLEVAKKDHALAPITHESAGAWEGSMPALSHKDVIIPAILFMQPMSPQVTGGTAAFGDFIESLNGVKLSKWEEGLEFVPFKMTKHFQEFIDCGAEQDKYLRTIDITPANEGLPYEDEEMIEGRKEKIKRIRVMKFYVLLESEVEAGTAIPYTISFKKSSHQAGKKLVSQITKNGESGKHPAYMKMKLVAKKETEGNKTWGVMDVVPTSAASLELQKKAFDWFQRTRTEKIKEHIDEEVRDVQASEEVPF